MSTVERPPVHGGRGVGPGRPRADLDAAIARAALDVLARDGYERLTMGAVAEAAGIGKPTLYRRHASKSRLVAAVLADLGPTERPAVPTDTRQALIALLAATAQALAEPGSLTIMGSLLAQATRDPDLTDVFRASVFYPRRDVVHAALEEGRRRGDVRPDLDVEAVDAMLFGALLARAILGAEPTAAWAERVVDAAWPAIGAVQPAAGGAEAQA